MNLKKIITTIFLMMIIFLVTGRSKDVSAASIQDAVSLNSQVSVTVPPSGDYLYSFIISETGVITITGDFDSTSDGWVKVLDANGKILATDEENWADNNITGKKNLSLVLQVTPGTYYLEFLNNYDDKVYTPSVYLKYTQIQDITEKTTLAGTLLRNELVIYKIQLLNTSYINFKGSFYEETSLTVYICDEKGVILDQDYALEDWKDDATTGLHKMNFNTMKLKKGTYYIRIVNQQNTSLSYSLKKTIKIPAASIKLNAKKLVLTQGKKFQLKATLSPTQTTDSVKWTSTDKKIVSVSSSGLVIAKKRGIAFIVATTTSGKQKQVKITVK